MLSAIDKDIWVHEADVRLSGGVRMPARATLLRLRDGELLLHSPLPIDEETGRAIDALGEVRFIVAPNCYHWLSLGAAHERYPRARVFGPARLEKKLGGLAIEHLPAQGTLDGIKDVQVEEIAGAPALDEHVFFHEPSSSLLVSDLMFNIQASPSLWLRTYLRALGARQKAAQSPVWRLLVKDRGAAAKSASRLLDWSFERLVVGHGDIVTTDARETARRALAWMTRG